MKDLIEEWEKSAEKYQSLGRSATDPIRQEGLFCRSEVYSYCADRLRRASKPSIKDGRSEDTHCDMCKMWHKLEPQFCQSCGALPPTT